MAACHPSSHLSGSSSCLRSSSEFLCRSVLPIAYHLCPAEDTWKMTMTACQRSSDTRHQSVSRLKWIYDAVSSSSLKSISLLTGQSCIFGNSFHLSNANLEGNTGDQMLNRSRNLDETPYTTSLESGKGVFWSIIIPTYNRLPILKKCLAALENQKDYWHAGIENYEVLVVDDGSTDGTVEFLQVFESGVTRDSLNIENICKHSHPVWAPLASLPKQSSRFPHVGVLQQQHLGAGKARNLGFAHSQGSVIVFIDSDLIVTEHFLKAHGEALREAFHEDGDDRSFTYGRVVNTNNFENPESEPFKLTDYSAAFFATGNVAISRQRLAQAARMIGSSMDGPFDTGFSEYGWEDLELGVRLRQGGARIKHAPAAVGYHWHPAFTYEQLPLLIEKERERGRNGVRFYQKHPTLNVRLMIQMTPFHEGLWFFLTAGGFINEKTMEPLLRTLVKLGQPGLALALISPILNWHTVKATKEEAKRLKKIHDVSTSRSGNG